MMLTLSKTLEVVHTGFNFVKRRRLNKALMFFIDLMKKNKVRFNRYCLFEFHYIVFAYLYPC